MRIMIYTPFGHTSSFECDDPDFMRGLSMIEREVIEHLMDCPLGMMVRLQDGSQAIVVDDPEQPTRNAMRHRYLSCYSFL